jgi:hypothetical protein
MGSWTATRFDTSDPDRKRLTMTVDELEEGFKQTRAWEQAAMNRFRNHPTLQISYEDLVGHAREANAKLLGFLGLPEGTLRTGLRQQNPESLRELITNYDELKSAFLHTPWYSYFDE